MIFPCDEFSEPQEVAVLIGQLSRDADLVAVEVVGLLAAFSFCACPISDLRQRFVGVLVGVDIGVAAVKYGTKKVIWKYQILLFVFFLRI